MILNNETCIISIVTWCALTANCDESSSLPQNRTAIRKERMLCTGIHTIANSKSPCDGDGAEQSRILATLHARINRKRCHWYKHLTRIAQVTNTKTPHITLTVENNDTSKLLAGSNYGAMLEVSVAVRAHPPASHNEIDGSSSDNVFMRKLTVVA